MNNETKKIIEELCTDLQAELDDRYSLRDKYESQMNKYLSEMDIVKRAKELIKKELPKERYFIFYYTATNPVGSGYIFIHTTDHNFPDCASVGKLALDEISKSLGYQNFAQISITGFNEFKSKEDYLAFKGE